jgi:hypothetical protein
MPAAQHATVMVNRAPVLTLWAAVVAERLGFEWDEALTLGRAVAGMNAHAKGVSIGIFQPTPKEVAQQRRKAAHGARLHVDLLRRAVPVMATPDGIRALSKDQPTKPEGVQRYIDKAFGEAGDAVRAAMTKLAKSRQPAELNAEAYGLYEQFRPAVPSGAQGWGAKGKLDLGRIVGLVN